jgi:hypothetical protein
MQSNRLAVAMLFAPLGIGLAAQGGVEKAQLELDAALAKGDKASYDRLLTDDFIWIGQDGRLRDKKAVVDELQPAPSDASAEGVESRPFPGGVVLFGTRRYPKAKFLRLWVQRGDRWQLAAHQESPIGEPAFAAPRRSSPMPPNLGPAAEIKAIEQAIADAGDPRRVDAASTRIYGDLAVTLRLFKPAGGQPLIQMIIHAKQSGKWLRAATIATARNPLVLLQTFLPVTVPLAPIALGVG